jgi:hypothetical protein
MPLFPPQFQAGPVLFLSLVLLKKRDKHNKEDKVFLLVELRIAMIAVCVCVSPQPHTYKANTVLTAISSTQNNSYPISELVHF